VGQSLKYTRLASERGLRTGENCLSSCIQHVEKFRSGVQARVDQRSDEIATVKRQCPLASWRANG